jgi:hypothetical protein
MTHAGSRGARAGAVAAVISAATAMTAGGQPPSMPPDAVVSPNACVVKTGSRSWCGDGGFAGRSRLAGPSDVAVAADGSVLIADSLNNVIRRVRPDGIITSIAGGGAGGPAGAPERSDVASFDGPAGVSASPDGTVLVADTGNDAIRAISTAGVVSTIVGGPGALHAALAAPRDVLAQSDGSMLIADSGHHRVLRFTPPDVVEVLAGTGTEGDAGDGGPGADAQLSRPGQLAVTDTGDVLIADTGNSALRRISSDGFISTVARAPANALGVLQMPDGTIVASTSSALYRVQDGVPQLAAGGPERRYNGDAGDALALRFNGIAQLALAGGRVIFAERGSDRVRAYDPAAGTVETIAGEAVPLPAPTLGKSAGRFPAVLLRRAAERDRKPLALARAARTSRCEDYDPRFATFTLIPQTRRQLSANGRRRIVLRFTSSRRADVQIAIQRNGRQVARKVLEIPESSRVHRVTIRGRFRTGRKHVVRMFGLSIRDQVQRCDVKLVRVRR